MDDLHAAVTARIDELERIAKAADYQWAGLDVPESEPAEVTLFVDTFYPAPVLRGLAEDRDILTRHVSEPGQHPDFCGYDLHELPCPEIRSLARRHGLEVPGDGR